MLNIMKVLKKYRKRIAAILMIPLLILSSLLIPSQKVKASTQISAWGDFQRTYQGNSYDFHVYGTQAQGLPSDYSFNSDVIDFVISKSGDAYNHTLYDSGIYLVDWEINTGMDIAQGVMSLFANAYIALNSFAQDYIYRDWVGVYLWEFEFTGADDNYVGSADYGTAYGFTFHGLCGDKIDLVLDSSGDFYGQNRIGNWTFGVQTPEYIPHIIHQADPDNVYVPTNTSGSFNDLQPPFFVGKELHFFLYNGNVKHELVITDFTQTVVTFLRPSNGYFYGLRAFKLNNDTVTLTVDNQYSYTSPHNTYGGSTMVEYRGIHGYKRVSSNQTVTLNFAEAGLDISNNYNINYPAYYNQTTHDSMYLCDPNNAIGCYNHALVSGSGDIWLDAISYTPVSPSINPIPTDVPIPVTEIPSNPSTPLPENPTPTPVPGITYPEPAPLPLPPFATIVSGNDDLWGITLDFEGAQDGLLPYMNSLSQFEFPSFTDLITDFSGSIIWVAQLMSILYNGTPLNVLFIALCLFSLVSVLIGAYKLWNSTEPDPGNPGMRRYKRPPKGGKKH